MSIAETYNQLLDQLGTMTLPFQTNSHCEETTAEKPALVTLVGYEKDPAPVILLPSASDPRPFTMLLQDADIIAPHPQELKPLASFQPVGHYHGPNERPYITLPLRSSFDSNVVYPVTFLANSGSPDTFVTPAVIQALGLGQD